MSFFRAVFLLFLMAFLWCGARPALAQDDPLARFFQNKGQGPVLGTPTFNVPLCHSLGRKKTDPIVLDLSSGGLFFIPLKTSTVFFDWCNDQFAAHTAWVGPQVGFLVTSNDAQGSQGFFGEGYEDGRLALRTLDDNDDFTIDAKDPIFARLRVWVDFNGNGKIDPGEVRSLLELGIVAIDLDTSPNEQFVRGHLVKALIVWSRAVEARGFWNSFSAPDPKAQTRDENGNQVRRLGSLVFSSGAKSEIAKVGFETDLFHTTYTRPVAINPNVLILPNLRGYGLVPDLFLSMSLDHDLLQMVTAFSKMTLAEAGSFDNKIYEILGRWTKADDVSPDSRGPYVNAQNLAMVERVLGDAFLTRSGSMYLSDPIKPSQGEGVNKSFWGFFAAVKQRLLIQSAALSNSSNLTFVYNADSLDGHADYTAMLKAMRDAMPFEGEAALRYWRNTLPMLTSLAKAQKQGQDFFMPEVKRLLADINLPNLQAALKNDTLLIGADEGSNLTTDKRGARFIIAGAGPNTLIGSPENDTLIGGSGDNIFHGVGGADVLFGGDGVNEFFLEGTGDAVYCGSGKNTILLKSDSFVGTRLYCPGREGTTIKAMGPRDISPLVIGGVTRLDVGRGGIITLTEAQLAQLKYISDGEEATSISTIKAAAPGSYSLERKKIKGKYILFGSAGDDTLYATEETPTLVGNGGRDVYIIRPQRGRVNTRIGNFVEGEGDAARGELRLIQGLSPGRLWFQRNKNDLRITVMKTTQTITISDWFSGKARAQLEKITTGDGMTLEGRAVEALIAAMASFQTKTSEFNPLLNDMPADSVIQSALSSAWQR